MIQTHIRIEIKLETIKNLIRSDKIEKLGKKLKYFERRGLIEFLIASSSCLYFLYQGVEDFFSRPHSGIIRNIFPFHTIVKTK